MKEKKQEKKEESSMSQYRDSFMLVEKEGDRRKKSEKSKHKGYIEFGFLDEER